jgi:hypothetical protein
MASWKFEGLDEYLSQLERLKANTGSSIGRAIYEGAGLVAKEVAAEIQKLPVSNQYGGDGITSVQKKGLIEGFGISHAQTDGFYRNVKLGFDGYNGQKTEKYPQGQPNSLIARSVNSGTSYRKKNPFVDRATTRSKKACEVRMGQVLEREIIKIVN